MTGYQVPLSEFVRHVRHVLEHGTHEDDSPVTNATQDIINSLKESHHAESVPTALTCIDRVVKGSRVNTRAVSNGEVCCFGGGEKMIYSLDVFVPCYNFADKTLPLYVVAATTTTDNKKANGSSKLVPCRDPNTLPPSALVFTKSGFFFIHKRYAEALEALHSLAWFDSYLHAVRSRPKPPLDIAQFVNDLYARHCNAYKMITNIIDYCARLS